jgi:hypothetical protein
MAYRRMRTAILHHFLSIQIRRHAQVEVEIELVVAGLRDVDMEKVVRHGPA